MASIVFKKETIKFDIDVLISPGGILCEHTFQILICLEMFYHF